MFAAPPAAVAPDADPKEAAGAIKEYEGFWGAADAAFEDEGFDRDALPVNNQAQSIPDQQSQALEAEGPEQLTFSAVTGWKRASDWVAELAAAAAAEAEPPAPPEEGEDPVEPEPAVRLCVVNPVGPSEEELDRLRIIHQKLQEKPTVCYRIGY